MNRSLVGAGGFGLQTPEITDIVVTQNKIGLAADSGVFCGAASSTKGVDGVRGASPPTRQWPEPVIDCGAILLRID
jgi:hypothetical protein